VTNVTAALDTGQQISLDDVERIAALQTRIDRKYVVHLDSIASLIDQLVADRHVVTINGATSFGYRSLYFDTDGFDSFRSTATRRRRRFKVRTRCYEATNTATLECKVKGLRGETVKLRQVHNVDALDVLDPASRLFVEAATSLTLLGASGGVVALRPTVWTSYTRSTLVDVQSGSRATIDVGLATGAYAQSVASYGNFVIVETKTSGSPCWVDRALWNRQIRPVSVSKFALATLRANPLLPDNRWHRLMTRFPA
jgi:hypothetical protein